MTRRLGTVTLGTNERALATAVPNGACWDLATEVAGGFTLVDVLQPEGPEMVLFDDNIQVVASIAAVGSSTWGSVLVVRDAEDRALAVVRGDGCGGVHAVTQEGNVLFFAGRGDESLDFLLTDAANGVPLITLFATALTLEVASFGPFRNSTHESPTDGLSL
jgi:hypothetical protein